ncbi:hypothetical protein [Actinomadura sp. 3N407]|uniref:hypothetical protein n=1 Tax=Actinomadura sp. 3N407 TaxID=3457423 RepID=UPI003FCD2EDF
MLAGVSLTFFFLARVYNFRLNGPIGLVLLCMALACTGVAVWMAMPGRRLGMIVGIISCSFALIIGAMGYLAWLVFGYHGEGASLAFSPDERYELFQGGGGGPGDIDYLGDVRIRTGKGLFAQESVVWTGEEDGPAPKTVRFTGSRQIEVVTDSGCTYRSTFDGDTLKVVPVHHVPRGADC